ncbi:DUF1496 domain-containing protein [Aliiroseovarius marinus]|uniref:DUF1496 domain-containing protein n=1 Tax=Aliiroseovarius marinus TaxID=2500159 RepID=UPI003D7D6A4F
MADEEKIPQVGPVDVTKKTSEILPEGEAGDDGDERGTCWFNGAQYSPGARVCSGGVLLNCYSSGSWGRVGRC